LVDTDSVDTIDSFGSNIRIQTRGNDILRVLPVKNDSVNQDWISDKTRFFIDSISFGRNFKIKSSSNILTTLVDNFIFSTEEKLSVQFVVGPQVSLETLNSIQTFSNRFCCNNVLVSDYKGNLFTDWGGS